MRMVPGPRMWATHHASHTVTRQRAATCTIALSAPQRQRMLAPQNRQTVPSIPTASRPTCTTALSEPREKSGSWPLSVRRR